ncbi:MAG: class I SAM-dependent methyltransferase [Candidatus Aminicenantales bacterium]
MNRREFFNRIARDWDLEHRNFKENKNLERLSEYFLLNEGDAVLDAGCGTGRLVPYLREKIGSQGLLIETDFSEEMLRIARSRNRQERLFFVLADAGKTPFKEKIFDAVICFALFPHLPEKKAALKEFHRILRPGKFLFIAHAMSREELNRYHSRIKGPVAMDFLPDEKEMKEILLSAGFSDLLIREGLSLYLARAKA